jgi:methionyl-tRNA synthetase
MAGELIQALMAVPPIILFIGLVWSLVWKGIALWKSARLNSIIWFIVLLVVNTFGILEILYIFVFSELSFKKSKRK